MDPSLALVPFPVLPAVYDRQVVVCAGPWLPVAIPAVLVPAQRRAEWAAVDPRLGLEERLGILLDGGGEDAAWALLQGPTGPVAIHGGIERRLAGWAARELARRQWPAPQDGVVVAGADPQGRLHAAGRVARQAVASALAGLAWPRWAGPVVVDPGAGSIPGLRWLARPAAPVVAVDPAADDPAGAIAGGLAGVALELSAPPRPGWPSWLVEGAMGVAQAHAHGLGPSPRGMQAIRQQAGGPALRRLVEDRDGPCDRELAQALMAWALSSRRQARLPVLLDAVRRGLPGPEAWREAYGDGPERLIRER